MAGRGAEMKAEIRAEQQMQEALRRAEEEERRLAHLDEAQRAEVNFTCGRTNVTSVQNLSAEE